MAGAGYRQFADGDVLTAAQVQTFLQDQAVMRFADSSARTTALGTAVAEGMLSYLDDANEVQVYDGSAWGAVGLPLGTATPTDGQILAFGTATSTWNPVDGGGLVAVYSADLATEFNASVASGASTEVTGLSVAGVALSDASNKLIISLSLGITNRTGFNGGIQVGAAVYDGTSLISIGDTDGSRSRVNVANTTSNSFYARVSTPLNATFVHSPGDTTSRTYSVHVVNMFTTTETLYVNRGTGDSDAVGFPTAHSSLVIQEVSV